MSATSPIRSRLFAALLVGAALAAPVPAFPQTTVSSVPVQSDEFRSELKALQGNLERLNQKIGESAKEVDRLADPNAAKLQVEQLQALVAEALASVADNGKAAELGRKAVGFAQEKLRQLQGSKFTGEERRTLVEGWQRIEGELASEVNQLAGARKNLSGLLRTIQQRGDYLHELQALNDGQRMLSVVRDLADEIRKTSESLREVLRAGAPPDG